ncbi:hypothetical protein EZV62_001687 [Acer yangbiense]|uniref:Gelsolin-like domain-containing protein n=1 Tax=Acer yangbiense TaxID=1000413 RepID=A0A5C7IVJ4_9ROSI|nr:hypothetical protein EZV62_001687 [Acer yangbiense]
MIFKTHPTTTVTSRGVDIVLLKSGPPQRDIHYWLGNEANKVDSALASDKALELDAALGSCAVQYREVLGQETEIFLVEGIYSSQSRKSNGETYKISFLTCKGDHVVHVKEFNYSSGQPAPESITDKTYGNTLSVGAALDTVEQIVEEQGDCCDYGFSSNPTAIGGRFSNYCFLS